MTVWQKEPTPTTVHYPAQEIGRLTAVMLLDALRNEEQAMSNYVRLRPKLVTRESTCAPKSI